VEELRGDPTVGPRPKVWTRGQKWYIAPRPPEAIGGLEAKPGGNGSAWAIFTIKLALF